MQVVVSKKQDVTQSNVGIRRVKCVRVTLTDGDFHRDCWNESSVCWRNPEELKFIAFWKKISLHAFEWQTAYKPHHTPFQLVLLAGALLEASFQTGKTKNKQNRLYLSLANRNSSQYNTPINLILKKWFYTHLLFKNWDMFLIIIIV